jgi:UDP-3-O-[3-hydroxymyristoyl] glucosamine N-acyltransferase
MMSNGIQLRKYKLDDISIFLSNEDVVIGAKNNTFSTISDIKHRTPETLDWISNKCQSPIDYITANPANFIICPEFNISELPKALRAKKTIIITRNPKLLFARIVNALFVQHQEHSISSSAVIEAGAKIGVNVHIGNNCYIGNAVIGDNTVIMDNCTINDTVTIGNNVLLKPGAQLGLGGFGFVRDENSNFIDFPQLGSLVIEDDVEIGPNTCIDKGSLSLTKIGRGTKIGAFVKIAHNCIIGKSCFIGAQVFIGGSVTIGDYNWIAPGTLIKDQLKIGSYSTCGLGSVVVKDIADHELWLGNPARFIRRLTEIN